MVNLGCIEMTRYNCYCFNCNKNVVIEAEVRINKKPKLKCTDCGKPVKIMGIKLNIMTDNGIYKKHV